MSQGPVDAARLGRLVADGRLDHQDAGQREHRAAGRGPRHAEQLDHAARPRAHPRGLQVFQELTTQALEHQGQADDHDDQAGDTDQPPAAGVTHDRGGQILLLAGLATLRPGDHMQRQEGEPGVDHRPDQRLQSRTGAIALSGDAKGGLAEAPEGIAREPDGEQPQRDQPVGLARQQLQGTLLVSLPRGLAERDQDRDPADEDVQDPARGEARPGQRPRRLAVRCPPGRTGRVCGYRGSHTRLYLVAAQRNIRCPGGAAAAGDIHLPMAGSATMLRVSRRCSSAGRAAVL